MSGFRNLQRIQTTLKVKTFAHHLGPRYQNIKNRLCSAATTMNETEDASAGFSAALTHIDAASYDSQLQSKQQRIENKFAEFNPPALEVHTSRPEHYRMRAEFTVWHEKDQMDYIMWGKDEKTGERVKTIMTQFPVANELINNLMPTVLQAAKASPILSKKLFQANFHTTLSGQSVITLIYHRKLDDGWIEAAKELRQSLATIPGAVQLPNVVGRSRKQKIMLDSDEVEEVLTVADRQLKYIQIVGSFSQPNAGVCQKMLTWAQSVTEGSQDHDLLELYCGNGNFTVALSPNFRQVVATEVSKSSVAAARRNFESNNVTNGFVARMSSEEFVEALYSDRKYNRLEGIDLAACDFKTIFVDPPRAGLDENTLKLLQNFERVVYVSCNPDTLHRDISALRDSFGIERFAMFDQFPYTHHVECGVYLKKKENSDGGEERGVKRKAEEEVAAVE